jgi:hypothetical protein
LYGFRNPVLLAEASEGVYRARCYRDDEHLLICVNPGLVASEEQFDLWMPDFNTPRSEIYTSPASLHILILDDDWWESDERLKQYMQTVCNSIVSDLNILG